MITARQTSWLRVAATLCMLAPAALVLAVARSPAMSSLPHDVRVQYDPVRQTVQRMEGGDLLRLAPAAAAMPRKDAAAVAVAFISELRRVFRLSDPASELKLTRVDKDELGFRHVRFGQTYSGLEVASADLIVHFNAAGELYLVTGSYVPTPEKVSTRPKIDASSARTAAAAALHTGARDWPAQLVVWPARGGRVHLAYQVNATAGPAEAWRVFIDAGTGAVLEKISTIQTARGANPRSAKPN